MKYVLGIDFGGGSSKATLLGQDGNVAAEAMCEYPTLYPAPGFTEQDPYDWYRATKENIHTILSESGVSPSDIAALSLDAATHTAVLLDADYKPLRRAIYWTDTRSRTECAYLESEYGDLIRETMLHSVDTIWTLPQLLWVKKNEPEIWKSIRHIVFAKDFVRHMLTGDGVTDFIEAEGSMLFDYGTLSWSKKLCGIIGLDTSLLPDIVSPSDIVGQITRQAAEETGLCAGMPVLCGTTDTVMEVFAAGSLSEGQTTVKLATAGRICIVTSKPYAGRHVINYSHIVNGLWYPGTATKSCAASYRWYRDTFGGKYRELDEAAKAIPAGCEGLMFHPYLSGELTPYGDPALRGSFTGIRGGHTKAHFSRAVLEGVAFSLLDSKKEIDRIGIPYSSNATIIGGGASSPLWRQIVADALGFTLTQKESSDSSLGSAIMAGTTAGLFGSYKEALSLASKDLSVTMPNPGNTAVYSEIFGRYKEIHDALAPVYDKM